MKRLNKLHDFSGEIEHLRHEPSVDAPEQMREALVAVSADQEVDRLKTSVDELTVSLEKATRRINRLLGEKSQLAAQLDKRDDQLQRLNRELGGHASAQELAGGRAHKTLSVWRFARAVLTALAEHVRQFLDRQPKATGPAEAGHQAAKSDARGGAPLVARWKSDVEQQIVVILMCGLDECEIEKLLPIVERDCSSRQMTPLCIIDSDAFELFRECGMIFEYLPPAGDRDRFDPSLHWDLYIQRRLALIRRKWHPVRVVAFGEAATETLTLWSSSPFEDTPLPAISAGMSQSHSM